MSRWPSSAHRRSKPIAEAGLRTCECLRGKPDFLPAPQRSGIVIRYSSLTVAGAVPEWPFGVHWLPVSPRGESPQDTSTGQEDNRFTQAPLEDTRQSIPWSRLITVGGFKGRKMPLLLPFYGGRPIPPLGSCYALKSSRGTLFSFCSICRSDRSYLARNDAVQIGLIELPLSDRTVPDHAPEGNVRCLARCHSRLLGRRVIEKHSGLGEIGAGDYLHWGFGTNRHHHARTIRAVRSRASPEARLSAHRRGLCRYECDRA